MIIEYPVFLPNRGQALNKPQEFLLNQLSPYSRNMEFYNELLQGRGGLSKFSSTVLSGNILTCPKFYKKSNNTRYNLFCTPKHIYSYDFGNSRFDILNRVYTAGTIAISGTAVTGNSTAFLANVKVGDYLKVGSGSIHTGSTWYEVTNVGDDTHLTLGTSAGTVGAGSAYVVVKIFTGGSTNFWSWTQFEDNSLASVIVLTNGVDTPVYWNGSGQVVNLSGLATGFTTAKYVNTFSSRIVFGWTVEGGANQTQRVRWGQPGNCVSYLDIDYKDFVDEPTDVKGMTIFGGYHILFKEKETYVGRYIGGDFVFDWQKSAQCFGTKSGFSIITRNDFMAYYGSDKKFHIWNLLQDKIISEENFVETREFNPNLENYIQGFNVPRKNQLRWFCPYGDTTVNNYTFVYDYLNNVPEIWTYSATNACLSFGSYLQQSDIYADDAIFGQQYADETAGYADDVQSLQNAETILYGGYDGYIRIADSGVIDDGVEFSRVLRLKRLNFEMFNMIKRLWKQEWWLEAESVGNVTIKLRLDNKSSYENATKTISLVPSGTEEFVKARITWDKHARDFQPEISSTDHFAVLGVINYLSQKRRTYVS